MYRYWTLFLGKKKKILDSTICVSSKSKESCPCTCIVECHEYPVMKLVWLVRLHSPAPAHAVVRSEHTILELIAVFSWSVGIYSTRNPVHAPNPNLYLHAMCYNKFLVPCIPNWSAVQVYWPEQAFILGIPLQQRGPTHTKMRLSFLPWLYKSC